jgi:serine/threonine-protein kinase
MRQNSHSGTSTAGDMQRKASTELPPSGAGDAAAAGAATEALTSSPKAAVGAETETELGAGDELGAWRLLDRLGQGGMGAVYLAERADGHFEQRAAIKLIRGTPGAQTLAQFARERQILATLQHPHIARLLDGGATPGGQPYLVMECVEGVPIDAYCEQHALGLGARLHLFQEVCGAVRFAHQRLIVHCDLKPSNVLVRADGTPVLLDFGIARALDRQLQDIGTSYFTPGYASPEQLRGDAVTTASDVYALGLILFELVSGRRARLDDADRTVALLGTAAIRPSELADAVPWRGRVKGDLDAIVLRATATDPQRRYASAEELALDVQRFVEYRPVHARALTSSYVFAKLLRRRWPTFAVGALIALLIAGFTWRLVVERDAARAAEHDARVQATAAERVSQFLVSVFNVANPKFNHKRDLSARDVLDQGAERIGKELADQPAVKAQLLETLGSAYRNIGAPSRAAELFRQAVDLYLDPRVDKPLAAGAVSSQLAVVYSNDIPSADAVGEARRSLALRERHAADKPLDLADAYNTLGVTFEAIDQFDQARAALQKGLDLRRAAHADGGAIASSLHNLALVAGNTSDHKAALAYLDEAMKLRREAGGEKSPGYQNDLRDQGVELIRGREYEAGVTLLERNLALCQELYGADSTHTADAHNELGSAVHDLGRFREAAAHYREAMRIASAESDSKEYLFPLNNLANAAADMGDYANAVTLFEQSLAQRRRTLAEDNVRVLRAKQNLGRALLEAGQLDRAKPLLDEALAGFLKRGGEDGASTAEVRLVLARWMRIAGRSADVAALVEALQHSKAKFTPLMNARLHALEADLAAGGHDVGAVVAARKAAWDVLRTALGEQHPQAAEYAIAYANALADAGRKQEATAIALPMLPLIDAAFVVDAPQRRACTRWR